MSASEKLKALDGTMDGEWKRISPGTPLIEGPFADVQALCDLRNALPQIVAVVEADAELAGYVRAYLAGHDARTELAWALEQRDAADAALDEALS